MPGQFAVFTFLPYREFLIDWTAVNAKYTTSHIAELGIEYHQLINNMTCIFFKLQDRSFIYKVETKSELNTLREFRCQWMFYQKDIILKTLKINIHSGNTQKYTFRKFILIIMPNCFKLTNLKSVCKQSAIKY